MNNNFVFKGKGLTIIKLEDFIVPPNNISGDLFFSGKDIALALSYKNTADAIIKHVYPEDKILVRNRNVKEGKLTRQLNNAGEYFINESGMYSLIFCCALESAKEFKRWVTKDVLPEIRKTGSYNSNSPVTIDEDKIKLIVEKLALENMLNLKTDKVLESVKYLRAHGITKAKSLELARKSMKYNITIDKILDEYITEQNKIKKENYEGKIKYLVLSLVKIGYTQKEAWIAFADVVHKSTGKDINKEKLYWHKKNIDKTYLDIVNDHNILKQSYTVFNRYVVNEKKKLVRNSKSA